MTHTYTHSHIEHMAVELGRLFIMLYSVFVENLVCVCSCIIISDNGCYNTH